MRFVEKEKLTSNEFESLAKDISSNFS